MVAPQQSNPIRPEFELGGLGRDTEAREQAPYERRVRLFVRLHGRRMLDQESGFRACQARAQPREGQISSRIQFPLDLRAHGCEIVDALLHPRRRKSASVSGTPLPYSPVMHRRARRAKSIHTRPRSGRPRLTPVDTALGARLFEEQHVPATHQDNIEALCEDYTEIILQESTKIP